MNEIDTTMTIEQDIENILSGYWYNLQCYKNGLTSMKVEIENQEKYVTEMMKKYKIL